MIPASSAPQPRQAEQGLRLVLAALAIILMLVVGACSGAADGGTGKRGGSAAPPNPLVFEIARADGAAQGWLLGTIHALPDGTRWRTPAITHAVAEADSLIVEVASLADSGASAGAFRKLAFTPGLPPLAERVPPRHRDEIARLAEEAGLALSDQRQTESWAAALVLARQSAPGDPANGVDRALLADFAGRPVRELEGARGQLALFDGLPEPAQRQLLLAVVETRARGASEAEALRAAWLSGDRAALEAAAQSGMMADPELRDVLLTQRNRRWLPLIEAGLEAPGRPLIAVGAAHLVGPDGLIALLEARGWRLTRLT